MFFKKLYIKYMSKINWLLISLLFAGSNAFATCTPNISNTSTARTTQLNSIATGDCVENTGTITTNGSYVYGMYSNYANNTLTNSGTINTLGFAGFAIFSNSNNTTLYNLNIINTTGNYAYGLVTTGDSNTLINIGKIQTQGLGGAGLLSDSQYGGHNTRFINIGQIITTGTQGWGIQSTGNNTYISHSGLITTSGNSSHGIVIVNSTSSVLDNSGIIKVTESNSAAIYVQNVSNLTVNLLKGSVIVGNIFALSATDARLNINLGSGASYAYSVTGPWTVTDLDNRPMVTGSAYAAGIGAQETASELLFQRTNVMNLALDRRLRSYASDEVDNQPYWLDVYYSDVTRNSGGNYSTQTAFSNYNYGITAGFKLPTQLTPLELVVNVEQSNLNIDSGNQKIDSSSIMTGLLAPNIIDVLGAKLSAKALLGYADHDGDRKVMTNSLLYNGSRQIKSDYNSTYAVLGTALTKLYPITDRLTADVILGIDLNTQRFESYKESDYFAWDSRTLTQLHSRVQTGLDYKLWGDKGSVFARVGAEHRDLIGGATQDYSINGTNVSFNTNNKNDTYLTAQIGVRAQLEKRFHLFGVVNTLHSSDSVNSVSGNIGLRADF